MPDWGSAYWPLDEASGTVVVDEGGAHHGTYYQQTYSDYFPPHAPTTPAEIEYRIEAPTVTGFGVGLNRVPNGRPGWSSPYNWSGFSVPTVTDGWGTMKDRQPFTIAAKMRWHGPLLGGGSVLTRTASIGFGSGSSGFFLSIVADTDSLGYSMEHPHVLRFGRGHGTTWSYIEGEVDIPASVDYAIWDDWQEGQTYAEPLKIPEWFHWVIRYDGFRKSLFMNYVKVAEDTVDDTINIAGFGSSLSFNSGMTADWAEAALWHYALTDEEITGEE